MRQAAAPCRSNGDGIKASTNDTEASTLTDTGIGSDIMFSLKVALGFGALLPLVHLAAGQAAEWGQCGGIGWTGATTCGTYESLVPFS